MLENRQVEVPTDSNSILMQTIQGWTYGGILRRPNRYNSTVILSEVQFAGITRVVNSGRRSSGTYICRKATWSFQDLQVHAKQEMEV